MRSNRILIVLPDDTLGGAEQVLKQICCYYSEQGYIIDVFFLKKKKEGNWENIGNSINLHYTRYSREKYGLIPMILSLWKLGMTHHFDLAFTSHTHTSGLVGLLKRLQIIKVDKFIARESTTIFDRFSGLRLKRAKLIYKLGYRSTDLLICQTSYMKEHLYRGMPTFFMKLKRIAVIPNPISLEAIKNYDSSERPFPGNYIVSAGRLIHEKGYDILIKSFYSISTNHPHLNLVIIGDGPMRSELETLISELDLKNRVFLMGYKRNVYKYFKYAEVCVVSSRVEGFPNVLLQMMSQNNKVISTLCAGDIDQIKGIFTCPPNNIEELTVCIETALNSECKRTSEIFQQQLQDRDISHFINKVHNYVGLNEFPIVNNAIT